MLSFWSQLKEIKCRSGRGGVRRLVASAILVSLAACSSPPPTKTLSFEEQVKQDYRLGEQLAQRFESEVAIKREVNVSVYLRDLAQTLSAAVPELRTAPLGVFLVSDRDGKWRNFSLPGNRIYLSIGLLRSLKYENEVAAAIAMELGHILKRHAFTKLEQPSLIKPVGTEQPVLGSSTLPTLAGHPSMKVEFFGPGGVFAYTDENYAAATQVAVNLLYAAGFDSRGLVSLWNQYQNNPKRSPYDGGTLLKLLERTREAISLYTPLRNPIVRSEAFTQIQKRIQRL